MVRARLIARARTALRRLDVLLWRAELELALDGLEKRARERGIIAWTDPATRERRAARPEVDA